MKDIPTSPRIALMKHNRRVLRLRLSILLLLLFLSIVGALSYFSFYPKFSLNKITIKGNSIVDSNGIETSIKQELSGKYFWLFSRSNFLIYPRNKIYNKLLTDFPRIENLSIKRNGLNTIDIVIKERAGSYLYCGESVPLNKEEIGENCYFVNNDGYIFDKAPYFSGDVYFKYYKKINESTGPMSTFMFTSARFHDLVRFMDNISSLGFKPSYLVVSDDGVYHLYLNSTKDIQHPEIIFKEDNDINTIFDNFSMAMKEKEFANEIKTKYDTLLYIDLRFKDKVLYKFY